MSLKANTAKNYIWGGWLTLYGAWCEPAFTFSSPQQPFEVATIISPI